ncbi:response regulator FixJ [Rhizobium mayense]|uniref:Response regulator FixJ n=1 Tax=Rhizobium mayense TaxID=1312184 RepID=A0ABT7JT13_9HYPH|nr:response regulator FixJ [Rhizobium mayense]MDL2398853.1 response regulator FixJ [Rhizobium mayense]
MPSDLTVHVVDDEEPFRKSLTFLLASAGFAVRAHESASAFLALMPLPQRACLVTDLRMPHMDGVELLKRLRGMNIDIPTIVITGLGDVAMAVQAMKAGAADFIEKPFKDEVLIAAIKEAAGQDEPTATDENVAAIMARLNLLTEREHQVLDGIVDGLQNKVIAFNLGISSRTVEVHRANVMAKMDARNLAELVRMVMAHDSLSRHRIST